MSKVLLINGSPRENGNTKAALTEVAKTLAEEGIESVMINLGKQAMQGCIACGYCGRIGKCTFSDRVYDQILDELRNGIDGFVVGSPVYYGGPNGSLCALMDRVCYSLNRYMQFKPAASVVVCRRGGASAAFDRLNKCLRPPQQVFHHPEHACRVVAVLEHGIWADTWTSTTGRGGHANHAHARQKHGLGHQTPEHGSTPRIGNSDSHEFHKINGN